MFKLIALISSILIGSYWISAIYRNWTSKKASKKLVDQLSIGNFNVVRDYLDMIIREKRCLGTFDALDFSKKIMAWKGKTVLEKFSVLDVKTNNNEQLIIISNAKVIDLLPGRYENREIEKFYSCWIHVYHDIAANRLVFRSTFPEDKEHQYLLEDLADEMYKLTN
jgi:hypothetical protein